MNSLKIQIVDDDIDFAEGIADILAANGHAITLARNGEEAIAQKLSAAFDLTLMDIKMPGLDGIETYRRYKRIDPHSNVYLMTGFAPEAQRDDALTEGALGVLSKPLDIDALLTVVGRFSGAALVLVVDDDHDFVESVEDILQAQGYAVETAFSGTEAIEKISANGYKAVVLDLRMGKVSGLDVFRRMRELEATLPTIIVTAYLDEERRKLEEIRTDQIQAVFSKPLNPEQFLAIIGRIGAQSQENI